MATAKYVLMLPFVECIIFKPFFSLLACQTTVLHWAITVKADVDHQPKREKKTKKGTGKCGTAALHQVCVHFIFNFS